MISIAVTSLKGNEKLAKDVTTESGVVLIPKGTILKKIYIDKLIELDIYSVTIENVPDMEIPSEIQEKETISDCTIKVKELIEKHFYSTNSELARLTEVADEIITDALNKPEVIMNVNNMRHSSENLYYHSVNVSAFTVLIAVYMKLKDRLTRDIAVGALLHDIGYSYVNANLRNVRLSGGSINEVKEKKKHVIYGYDLVENEKWLSTDSKNIIINHHERINGSGYPFRKTGDKIDIGSKIVAVADEFDNVVNGKLNESVKVYNAIDQIVCQSDILYDKKVIEAFRSCVAAYPIGTVVITNNNEVGVVIRQNAKFPTRPVIRIIRDNNNKDVDEVIERNLVNDLTLFIEDTIE